jgi:hypothetical protein
MVVAGLTPTFQTRPPEFPKVANQRHQYCEYKNGSGNNCGRKSPNAYPVRKKTASNYGEEHCEGENENLN